MEFNKSILSAVGQTKFPIKQERHEKVINNLNIYSQHVNTNLYNDFEEIFRDQAVQSSFVVKNSDEIKFSTDIVKEEYVEMYPDVIQNETVFKIEFDIEQSQGLDDLDPLVNVEDTFSSDTPSDNVFNFDCSISSPTSNNSDDDKTFECFSCRRTFNKKLQLENHLKKCFRPFECTICRRRFKCRAYLVTHQQTHNTDDSIKKIEKILPKASVNYAFVCNEPNCNKKFSRKDRLIVHRRIHTGNKPYQCDEDGCGKKFCEWSNLEKHRRIHIGDKRFACNEPGCNKNFSAKCNLIEHKRIHTGEKGIYTGQICKICDKSFTHSSSYRKHLKIHTGVKPYVCNYPGCDKKFLRKYRLVDHNRVHTGEKPFVCIHCNRKFSDKSYLKRHLLNHTN